MRNVAAGLLLLAHQDVPSVAALRNPPKCARVAFGSWSPPLDWKGAGNATAPNSLAQRVRFLRDSVYAAGGGAGASDEMQWITIRGHRALVIFPAWWPVGVIITLDSADGTALRGEARALRASGNAPVSRARAVVVATCQ